jgi:hypothetical protein
MPIAVQSHLDRPDRRALRRVVRVQARDAAAGPIRFSQPRQVRHQLNHTVIASQLDALRSA